MGPPRDDGYGQMNLVDAAEYVAMLVPSCI